MNWRLVAIPVSVVPFIILFLTTKVSPQDVFAVGFVPFAASAAAEITRFMLQAARFKYFIKRFIGYDVSSTAKTISARLAGEFVTQTTPSYVGGEFVRIAWLSRHGVPPGKAAWVATMEIIADVFVGSMRECSRHRDHFGDDPNIRSMACCCTVFSKAQLAAAFVFAENSGEIHAKRKG